MSAKIDDQVLNKYEILGKLGQGAYGYVWKVRRIKNGSIVALKKIYDAFRNEIDAQRTFREIEFLTKLDHPNIVRLMDIYDSPSGKDIYLEI